MDKVINNTLIIAFLCQFVNKPRNSLIRGRRAPVPHYSVDNWEFTV